MRIIFLQNCWKACSGRSASDTAAINLVGNRLTASKMQQPCHLFARQVCRHSVLAVVFHVMRTVRSVEYGFTTSRTVSGHHDVTHDVITFHTVSWRHDVTASSTTSLRHVLRRDVKYDFLTSRKTSWRHVQCHNIKTSRTTSRRHVRRDARHWIVLRRNLTHSATNKNECDMFTPTCQVMSLTAKFSTTSVRDNAFSGIQAVFVLMRQT